MRSYSLLGFCLLAAFLSLAIVCNKSKDTAYPEFINKILKEKPEKTQIQVCTFKKKKAYIVNTCVGCPDYLVQVVDKEEKKICEVGGIAGLNTCKDAGIDLEKDCKIIYTSIAQENK